MPKSTAMMHLRRMFGLARAANREGQPLIEVVKRVEDLRASSKPVRRRDMIKGLSAVAGAATVLSLTRRAHANNNQPVIAIVGGGIAGLVAAMTLDNHGVDSTIYEANPTTIGGRIHSKTDWANGQTSEWCGEFIDSGHKEMRKLAHKFGLTLVDELAAQPPGSTDTLFLNNAYYDTDAAFTDFQRVAHVLERQASNNWPTTYNPDTQTGESIALDQMSVDAWIDRYVRGGLRSPLGLYMQTAYVNEFGLDGDAQSALNLVYEMGFQDDPDVFSIYGESDQRYHVRGGNDQIPQAIAASLPQQNIKLGWSLNAIVQLSDGRFTLTFATPNGTRVVTADHVMLTIPFSVLRGLNYQLAGFDTLKVKTIQDLGYGTNSKLSMQMTQRLWNTEGPWGLSTGSCYSDLAFQNTWDSSQGIPGATAVFVAYNGGSDGTALGGAASPWVTDSDPRVCQYVRDTLKQLNKPFPGIGQLWSGRATLSTPWRDPHFKGSYACWKVGQYTTIAGYEPVRQGNCHFAGEHCTNDFQGFMEGGATTGKQAAREVLKDLNIV